MTLPAAVTGFGIEDETVNNLHGGEEGGIFQVVDVTALGPALGHPHQQRADREDDQGDDTGQDQSCQEPTVSLLVAGSNREISALIMEPVNRRCPVDRPRAASGAAGQPGLGPAAAFLAFTGIRSGRRHVTASDGTAPLTWGNTV